MITGYYTFTTFVDEEKCISDGSFETYVYRHSKGTLQKMFFLSRKFATRKKYNSKNIKLRATAAVVGAARSAAVLRCHGLCSAQRWPPGQSLIRRPHPPGSSLEQEITPVMRVS